MDAQRPPRRGVRVDEHEIRRAARLEPVPLDPQHSRAAVRRGLERQLDVVVAPKAGAPRQQVRAREHVRVAVRRPQIPDPVLAETDVDPELPSLTSGSGARLPGATVASEIRCSAAARGAA